MHVISHKCRSERLSETIANNSNALFLSFCKFKSQNLTQLHCVLLLAASDQVTIAVTFIYTFLQARKEIVV